MREQIIHNAIDAYGNFLSALGFDWKSDENTINTPRDVVDIFLNNTVRPILQAPNEYSFNHINCGVYIIKNLVTDQCYIGSSLNIKNRKYSHFYLLQKNRYGNRSKLQNSFNKYGEKSFIFICLEFCSRESRIAREQYYIDLYKPFFNNRPLAASPLGFRHSSESIEMMSKKKRGKSYHSEYQLNILKKLGSNPELVEKRRLGLISALSRKENKKWSEERKRAFREKLENKNINGKPVLQIDISTEKIIAEFPSASAAARFLNLRGPGDILACSLGKQKTSNGYIWKRK